MWLSKFIHAKCYISFDSLSLVQVLDRPWYRLCGLSESSSTCIAATVKTIVSTKLARILWIVNPAIWNFWLSLSSYQHVYPNTPFCKVDAVDHLALTPIGIKNQILQLNLKASPHIQCSTKEAWWVVDCRSNTAKTNYLREFNHFNPKKSKCYDVFHGSLERVLFLYLYTCMYDMYVSQAQ